MCLHALVLGEEGFCTSDLPEDSIMTIMLSKPISSNVGVILGERADVKHFVVVVVVVVVTFKVKNTTAHVCECNMAVAFT